MNKRNLHAAFGSVFLIAVGVAVFVASMAVHGQYAPRGPSGEIINLGQSVFNDYKDLTEFALERGFRVTADIKNPDQHNKGSLHSKGLAIDVSIKKHTPEDVEEFMLEAKAAGLRVLDERCRPKKQKKWGGSHVHLEISKLRSTNQKNKCRASRETPADKAAPPPAPPPAPVPPPEPVVVPTVEVESKLDITSTSCVLREQYSDGSASHWVDVSGTASGSVDARVAADTSSGVTATCGSWHKDTDWSCKRQTGDPEQTLWTFRGNSYPEGSTGEIYFDWKTGEVPKSATFNNHCPSR